MLFALFAMLLPAASRSFAFPASRDDTWDFTINNRVQLPHAAELQLSYIRYAGRNVPQGRGASSFVPRDAGCHRGCEMALLTPDMGSPGANVGIRPRKP